MVGNIPNVFCMSHIGKVNDTSTVKPLVENMRVISVFELRPQHVLRRHFAFEDILCHSGGYSFYRKYDPREDDFYLELISRGPRNSQSTINFVETKCNYGGTRWWFECPKCQRRCAKLYEKTDNFYCRTCLDLEYTTHRINYRSAEIALVRLNKLEKMREKWRPQYSYYGDRMTHRARREEKLLMQTQMSVAMTEARMKRFATR